MEIQLQEEAEAKKMFAAENEPDFFSLESSCSQQVVVFSMDPRNTRHEPMAVPQSHFLPSFERRRRFHKHQLRTRSA